VTFFNVCRQREWLSVHGDIGSFLAYKLEIERECDVRCLIVKEMITLIEQKTLVFKALQVHPFYS
jgi:hypothetical protein